MSLLHRVKRLRFPYGIPRTKPTGFDKWLDKGMAAGWCGPAICLPHDGLPMTHDEEVEAEEGWDPCVHILRLYADQETRDEVELNHSPSTWRKPTR